MKILNFGSCNVDFVYSLDHIVKVGETETTDSLSLFPGGKGLNQSIALAKAGVHVYHAGCIGNDGEILTDILTENNVDLTYIKYADTKNGHAIIQVSADGDNSIFLYPGSNVMITREHIDEVLSHFSKGDIILLQNEINNIEYIIDRANAIGMQIILNPSPYNEVVERLDFGMLTYLILNEVEAGDITGKAEPEEALMYFKSHYPKLKVILTLGKKGCIYQDSENKLYHPIFSVKAVDTTAAGDTFTGYFVAGLAEGLPYKDILKTASCASAITVSRMGAAPSIPCRSEVQEHLNKLKIHDSDHKGEALLRKTERFIEDNLDSITLEDISKLLGYSSVYTGNLIKKLSGKPFKKLVQDKRIEKARALLITTDLTVGEIIKATGYENESFFREIFKEKYGANPLTYRKSFKRQ